MKTEWIVLLECLRVLHSPHWWWWWHTT